MRSKILQLILSCLVCVGATDSADIVHIESEENSTFDEYSQDRALGRLADAAREYEQYAPVPRIALFDLTLPANVDEYRSLDGFAFLTVTIVSQVAAEVPPSRVFVRQADSEVDLTPIAGLETRVAASTQIAQVLGSYRYDGLFEFPLNLQAEVGELVLDFGANRKGFVLSRYPAGGEPDEFPDDPPTAAHPKIDAMRALVKREIPIFSDIVLGR